MAVGAVTGGGDGKVKVIEPSPPAVFGTPLLFAATE
jgi:hypothetical protein